MALIVEFYLKTYYCSVGILVVLLVFNDMVIVFIFYVEVLAPIKR